MAGNSYNWENPNGVPLAAGDMPSGIDAAKVADGTVSSTEYQALANVTSDLQTQIDGKLAASSTKLPPTPSGAGKIIYDNGTAYVALPAGDGYLKNTSGVLSWSSVSSVDLASPGPIGGTTPAAVTGTAITGNTSVLTNLLDARTATTLAIGTTTATGIGLQQDTTLAAGKSLIGTAGTGGLSLSSMTGNSALPVGDLAWFGNSGKNFIASATNAAIQFEAGGGGSTSYVYLSGPLVEINGGGTGVQLKRASALIADAGYTSTTAFTIAANKNLAAAAGTTALNFGSATGDTTFGTGSISGTLASNKTFAITTQGTSGTISLTTGAANLNLATGTGGSYRINLTADQIRLTATGGAGNGYLFTGNSGSGLTASTEVIQASWNLAQTYQFSTGALTTQRAFLIQAPTYSFTGASTLTNAATFAINAAPSAGSNATITNAYALWVQAGASRFDGVVTAAGATATPAGGSTSARLLFGTTAGFGVYYGSGAPTVSAAKGSLYLRSDGSAVTDRMYVNTDGSTAWTAVATAS